MKPRWQLKKDRIAQILKIHGLEVRMWDIEDGVFLGAIVDGYKPNWAAEQAHTADGIPDGEYRSEEGNRILYRSGKVVMFTCRP